MILLDHVKVCAKLHDRYNIYLLQGPVERELQVHHTARTHIQHAVLLPVQVIPSSVFRAGRDILVAAMGVQASFYTKLHSNTLLMSFALTLLLFKEFE